MSGTGNQLVFVYGTLRKGGRLHNFYLDDSKLVGPATVQGDLFDSGSFPSAMPGEGTIVGEIYEVTPDVARQLDQLERHPQWYEREAVYCTISTTEAPFTDRRTVAWIYWGKNVARGKQIESGDWLQYERGA